MSSNVIYVSHKQATPEIPAGHYVQDDSPWTITDMLSCLENLEVAPYDDIETLADISDMAQEFLVIACDLNDDTAWLKIKAHAERLGVYIEGEGWFHETHEGQEALARFWEMSA